MSPVSAHEHRAAILHAVQALGTETVPLAQAAGRVLAADVTARTPVPPFANSAMDGYAVRAVDVAEAGTSPVRLPVAADAPAGSTARLTLAPGTAIRIMTGAPLPDGADTIVQLEATDDGTDVVEILQSRAVGTHVRGAGDDVAAGQVVLVAGTRLTARHLGAAAAAGRGELEVHLRPRVAVISTGSELVEPGADLEHGQIPDSNSHVLAAAVAEVGGDVVRVPAVDDDEAALAAVLADVVGRVDAIVLSGGVSVGDHDVVKAVLAPRPGMWFGPVRMQPGKPQGWGVLEEGPLVLALPGNPVSVFVSFEVFVGPALRALGGERDVEPRFVPARAATSWTSPAGREQYMPVVIDRDGVTPLVHPASRRGSGSHLVGGLAGADGLARVPADVTTVAEGDAVHVLEARR